MEKSSLIILMIVIAKVSSHSWLACVDYTEKNGAHWDPAKCRGFPRDASRYAQKNSFGMDRGFDHKPGMEGKACKTDLQGDSYNALYPKAVYYPGQQVILVHPMKNHGTSAKCTNIHIPDFGNRIYHGMEGRDHNEPYSYYRPFLVADLGLSKSGAANTAPDTYPKPGYQNAPAFCENTDKAMGTYSFNIPENFKTGEFTFVWRWSFNGPTDIYTTCFDVIIAPNKAKRDQILMSQGELDLSVPCGGILSNEGEGSTKGCGTQIIKPTTPPPVTTQRPVITTTTKATIGTGADVMVYQLSGEVSLGEAARKVVQRYISVQFNCKVEATFWNARLVSKANHDNGDVTDGANRYELLQERKAEVASGKVYFSATFVEPCDVNANPPIATVVDEVK